MGRILAIDYGQKRVGFAVTDELQIIAHALDTVSVSDAYAFLLAYLQREKVDCIVIGMPKKMDNSLSDATRYIEPFVNRLKKNLPEMPIIRVDERFTSQIAFQTMIDAGIGKKGRQDKALVDKISATIILQTYIQQIDIEKDRTNQKNNIE